MQVGAKTCKKHVCNVYIFRLSCHFCTPPLVVGKVVKYLPPTNTHTHHTEILMLHVDRTLRIILREVYVTRCAIRAGGCIASVATGAPRVAGCSGSVLPLRRIPSRNASPRVLAHALCVGRAPSQLDPTDFTITCVRFIQRGTPNCLPLRVNLQNVSLFMVI